MNKNCSRCSKEIPAKTLHVKYGLKRYCFACSGKVPRIIRALRKCGFNSSPRGWEKWVSIVETAMSKFDLTPEDSRTYKKGDEPDSC